MLVTIIDCGAGNLHSVRKALGHVLGDNAQVKVTQNAADLAAASHIILPGVGAFADCVAGLNALPNMRDSLEREVLHNKKPFLGICVGMQMLFEHGHEYGVHKGLGWFKGQVRKLAPIVDLPVPHMGWNQLQLRNSGLPIWRDIAQNSHAYFVHSFHVTEADVDEIMAEVDYGGPVVAMIGRENIIATQFHPEKSQQVGLTLLRNFIQPISEQTNASTI